MRRRIFVIGLDGVGFPLIEPWIAAGKLPHLAQAVESGTHGTLESTIPPLTGPAWSSFQTGVNPGKHGVSSWTKRRRGATRSALSTGMISPIPPCGSSRARAGERL